MCGEYVDSEGDTRCENDEACEHFSLSWNLPYKYEDGILTVTNDPVRFHWKKDLEGNWENDLENNWENYYSKGNNNFKLENPYCPINGMEAGFYYRAASIDEEEKIDYRQIIRAEWKKAGWEQASPIRETEAKTERRKLLAELARLIEML